MLPEQPTQNYQNSSTPIPDEPPSQSPPRHKWRRKLVWCLNIVPPLLFVLLIVWLSHEQSNGVSGTEFIAIAVAPIFGLLFLITLIIDVVLLIRFLRKNRSSSVDG